MHWFTSGDLLAQVTQPRATPDPHLSRISSSKLEPQTNNECAHLSPQPKHDDRRKHEADAPRAEALHQKEAHEDGHRDADDTVL